MVGIIATVSSITHIIEAIKNHSNFKRAAFILHYIIIIVKLILGTFVLVH